MKITLIITLILTSFISYSSNDSVYNAFGKKAGITKLVNLLTVKLQADKRTNSFFKETDIKRFKEKLSEQICKETGGPCEYTGQNMKRAHKGHEINRKNFYDLVEILQTSMSEIKIPNWAQNKLLSKLAIMHKDVVNE